MRRLTTRPSWRPRLRQRHMIRQARLEGLALASVQWCTTCLGLATDAAKEGWIPQNPCPRCGEVPPAEAVRYVREMLDCIPRRAA